MKKNCFLIMVLIMVIVLGGCAQNNSDSIDSNEVSSGNNTVVIGTAGCYPPLEWVDEKSNELCGFDIDLMNAICEEIGLEPEYKIISFDGLIPALQSGEIDVIACGLTITEERKEAIAFSDSYLKSGDTLMYNKDLNIKSPEDLSGEFIAVQANSSTQIRLEELNEKLKQDGEEVLKLKMFKTMQDAIAELKIGSVKAVAIDYPMAADFLSKNPNEPFKMNEPFGSCDFGLGINKNNTELVEKINEGLAKVKESGQYKEIFNKYFSK